MWLLSKKPMLIWDRLLQRGWQGRSICTLCQAQEEDFNHLFFEYIYICEILPPHRGSMSKEMGPYKG